MTATDDRAWLYTADEASQFFFSLRKASVEILTRFGLPTSQGHKSYRHWHYGHPVGVTEHFTAGVGWKGSVRWLNDGPHYNTVSCQLLILDRMLVEAKDVYAKYPKLSQLKATVIMLSDGLIPCWHAGWINKLNVGIENRNAGPLVKRGNGWCWWAKRWTAPFPHAELDKMPQLIDGRWWEPFTYCQVHDNILIGQYLHCLYQKDGGLDRRWFLPHSATTGTKNDTGRAYPLHDVRNAVFAQMPIDGIPWLKAYANDPVTFIDDLETEEDQIFLQELAERQSDRMVSGADSDLALAGVNASIPDPNLQDLVQHGRWRDELDSVRLALHKLGYVIGGQGPDLDEDTALAVYQFQQSVKLKTDRIPGAKTQAALWSRLNHFNLTH